MYDMHRAILKRRDIKYIYINEIKYNVALVKVDSYLGLFQNDGFCWMNLVVCKKL